MKSIPVYEIFRRFEENGEYRVRPIVNIENRGKSYTLRGLCSLVASRCKNMIYQ